MIDQAPVVVPPPPPVPSVSAAMRLWDGVSGTTGTHYNVGAKAAWLNKSGDWLDANDEAQGAVPYAVLTVTAVGAHQFDATALARKWHSGSNSGAFVRFVGGGTLVVASRTNPDPALRPTLTLVLSDGSTVIASCLASGVTNPTTIKGVVGATLSVYNVTHLCLQFDLTDIGQRTIATATLRLTSVKLWSGSAKLEIHELRAPRLLHGAPAPGLASAHEVDANIDAHPDVYFASNLTDQAQRLPLFPETHLPNSTVTDDEFMGSPALNVKYRVGELAGMVLVHRWSQKKGVTITRNPKNGLQLYEEIPASEYQSKQHPGTPRELFFRYYIKLAAGYQCSIEGKKLPGLAGRYGWWNSVGYYQFTAGNGGGATKGTYEPAGGYSGWSMRALASIGPADDNPYKASVSPLTYAYHAAMPGPYGDNWTWGNDGSGVPLLEPDRWYCIEQHAKMNSVVGPFDQYGNGVGVADGVLEVWVDGIKVFAKTDVVFRKNLAIGIDEVWLDHYHGGTVPAEADHGFAMTGVVVARKYIGPRMKNQQLLVSSGLAGSPQVPAELPPNVVPSWVPAAGVLADVSSSITASFDSVRAANYSAIGTRKVIRDFSARVGCLSWGNYGGVIAHGGGHSATNDNSVFVLELQESGLAWKRVSTPYDFGSGNDTNNQSALTDDTTGHYPDGQPCSFHSYDLLAIREASDGGAANGTLITPMRTACGAAGVSPNDVRAAHSMALTDTVGPFAWTHLVTGTVWTAAPGSSSAYDPTRNRFWFTNAANQSNAEIRWLDVTTNTFGSTTYTGAARPIVTGAVDLGCLRYDAVNDILIFSAGGTSGTSKIAYLDCTDPAAGWVTPTLTGATITGHASGTALPMTYVAETGNWYMISRGDLDYVYEITIPATITDDWSIVKTGFGATLPTFYVPGKAWTYFPNAKSIVFVSDHNVAHAYRPSGV